jgi:hypothetical protein
MRGWTGLVGKIDGAHFYYVNGLLHREDGPAIIEDNGDKFWMQNHMLHRLDGPASEFADGGKEWFIWDEKIPCSSQEEFERVLKLRTFW